jgi:2-acylglycerol O-acyltransferase 2
LGRNDGVGNAVVVVVGGASESMLVPKENGGMELILDRRKGFVREAILGDACLVPVLAFGENDLYHVFETDDEMNIARFQRWLKQTTGFAMPLFQGRSIFFKSFGVMPMRKPVVVVCGAPIEPPTFVSAEARAKFDPQIDRKTNEPLNKDGEILVEWHSNYVKALKELYDKYKDAKWNQPGYSRQGTMAIVN